MRRLIIPCTSQADAARLADALEAIDGAFATGWQETDEAKGLFEAEAYFHDEPAADALAGLGVSYEIRLVEEENWVDQSLQQFQPVRAGRFFIHGSHHSAAEAPGAVAIEIDAGLAFGTGHHATTSGCLWALDTVLKRHLPRRVLDLGCGTGLLAIAAIKATGRPVVASDIDPVAVETALQNARCNGVHALIRLAVAAGFSHPTLRQHAPYELILANILANPLMALSSEMARHLAPGGCAILSGILTTQAARVAARYRAAGLVLTARQNWGDWAVLTVRRPARNITDDARTSRRR